MIKSESITILVGTISSDIKSGTTSAQSPWASFTIETSDKWKDKETGEIKQAKQWHKISAFGAIAQTVIADGHKGVVAYVRGSNKTRKNENGVFTEVSIREFIALGAY